MVDDKDPRIEKLVDMLILADRIADRYVEKKRELEEEADFEPLSLIERVSLVHALTTISVDKDTGEAKGLQDQMAQVTKLIQAKTGAMKLALEDIYRSEAKDVDLLKAIAKKALVSF